MELSAGLSASAISAALAASLAEGRSLAIVSLLDRDGSPLPETPRLLLEEDAIESRGTLGHSVLDDLARRYAARLIAGERQEIVVASPTEILQALEATDVIAEIPRNVRLLFEISRPQPELIVCGAGHVGHATATAARFLDFQVTVIDDRPEFTAREKFPDPAIQLITDDFVTALRSLKITRASHVVIVTRGHRHDEICLKEVVAQPARYIGMIGSRRRTTTIREHLRKDGVAAEHLQKVCAPIGLDIGAVTPEEIALAILSEIILVRRGGTGRPKGAEGPMAKAK